MAMLEVKDIQVYYGMIQAIKGISFEVNEGEVIALIGANGAGKTTTLQTITGLIAPKHGEILFEGQNITKVPAHEIVSMGMAHVPEGRASSRVKRFRQPEAGRIYQKRQRRNRGNLASCIQAFSETGRA